jgi:hypothetical protein
MKRNILNILGKKLTRLLRYNLLPEKSYLAGGTAVYFYLKHRVSVDLDFFTPTCPVPVPNADPGNFPLEQTFFRGSSFYTLIL